MISDRIEALITHFCKGNKSLFANKIGVTPSVIGNITGERKGNPSFEVIQKILDAFASVNPDWFILDRGPMLRADGEPTLPTIPSIDTSKPSDTVILRLMDKLDEKDTENKQLQSELRQQSIELAALKAKYHEFQDKDPEPIIGLTDSFTDKSSGDYGEGFMPTKKSPSKKSSAGKAL